MTIFATDNIGKKSEIGLRKSTVTSDLWVNVNRMNGVFRNNGTWFYDNILGDWGLEWPKGSGLSPIFGAGQFLGANVGGTVKVAASYHNHTEFQAGQIIDGVATNPLDPQYRWYVIRPEGVGDWDSWPFHQGAPSLKAADGSDSLDATGNKIPKLIGDITAYCVINDYAEHAEFATPKLGAEIGMTLWAFNRADAIGDMIFIKWTLVNKSSETWDETYFAIWSDPDVGDGWDDFVGCDTVLGLGYCYNATDNDQNYGVAPPAVGIDFFQGPIIDSPGDEVSLPDGSVIADKKMLKMTSFIYYNNDDSNQGNPQTGGDVWNYLRGLWRDGNPITFGGTGTDPNGTPAPFMFSGNPEDGDGWLDSDESDRRFMMTTGAYSNEPWTDSDGDGIAEFGEPGVQEIVAGAMVGRGSNNLNSVTFLKAIDEIAQLAYDIDFALPPSPKQPVINKSENDGVAVLSWDDRSEYLDEDKTEAYEVEDIVANGLLGQMIVVDGEYKEVTDGTYNFTGYTVYQYSDSSGSDPVVYAELGVSEIVDATPYSDSRMIRLERNLNPKVGNVGDGLVNGQNYFFGVAANSYCKFAVPKVFSSAATYITITPQIKPGERYSCVFGDTIDVNYSAVDPNLTSTDGEVIAIVVSPEKVTGDDYKVVFKSSEAGDPLWDLINTTKNTTVLENQTNQNGDDAYTIKDGLLVKVKGPDAGINTKYPGPYGDDPDYNGYETTGGNRWVSWPTNWGLETMGGALGNGASFFGSDLEATDYVTTELRFAGVDTWPQADSSAEALAAVAKIDYPDRWSKAVVYRRDLGYGVQAELGDVPFTAWDMEATPPRQLKLAYVEDANDGSGNLLWDMGWDGSGFPERGGREYMFILNDTYDEQYTEYLNGNLDGTFNNSMYAAGWGARGSHPYLESAFEIKIIASHVNSTNDIFTFSAPDAKTSDKADLKADIKKINVVPNPYYGYHRNESNIFARWVQFNNLPANQKVTIKIFDLAGNRIRTLKKPEDATTILEYDLKNEYDLPIASGIYVYHVEVKGVGNKVGKMAVFAPNERLDTY